LAGHRPLQSPVLVGRDDLLALGQSGEARLREVGRAMAGRLRELPEVGGDRHRQRRLLVAGAYRSDELYPRLPMRQWRTRLLIGRQAEEARLPRLTRDQTAALTRALLGQAPPARIVEAVQDRSDGIPLHVEELLAAVEDPVAEPGPGAIPALPVPDTLADAVLARARALDDQARQVADAGAVIGRSFELELLTTVSGLDPEAVDGGLRRLRERYLVVPGTDPDSGFDFRHTLLRDVLYGDIPLPQRRRLHQRVAEVAAGRGGGPRLPDARVLRLGPGRVRPGRAVAGRRRRLRRAGRALEPPPLHGRPPGPRPVGGRPLGRGRPDGRARPGRRARRHHHPDHRRARPRLPGHGTGRVGPGRRAARRRPPPGRGHGRAPAPVAGPLGPGRDGPAARRPRGGDRPVRPRGRRPRTGSATPPTCSRSWSPGSGPGWPARDPTRPSGGWPRSPGPWPPARSPAPWSPSTTAGACSSWPGATSRPPGRPWTAPPPGGPGGAGSGRAPGPRLDQATARAVVAEADRLLAGAAGNTNRQIAAELFLSPKTVGSHVEHILAKLGVGRRAEIAAWVASLPSASTPAGD
jgi:DNA-binding CsgD family transcriptional regulator